MAIPVDEAIDAIYEAATRPEGWSDALTTMRIAFKAQASSLYTQYPNLKRGRLPGFDSAITFGHSDRALREYSEYFHVLNPFARHAHRFPLRQVGTDANIIREFVGIDFAETEFFNDWAKPQRLRHVIGAHLRQSGHGLLCAAFWRPASEGCFTEAETASFSATVRHISRALDVGFSLRAAEAEMEAMIGRSASAVFTLDRNGRVKQMNAVADALVRSGDLRLSAGGLRAAIAQDQARLDRLVACALDPRFAAWAEHARVELRRSNGQPPLTACAISVAHRFDPFGPDRSASVILTIEGCEAERSAMRTRMRRRFGLSPAQARVAAALAGGGTLQDAAAALEISYETARTHLKAIFERTGAHRQAELMMLLRREVER